MEVKRQSGSHKTLERDGWPDIVFAFHDGDEVGPKMLARLSKHTGLTPIVEASMLSAEYEISCDPDRIDIALVHDFLRTSYWAEGRSRETVERSISNSLCFGVYVGGRQVGFARVITDKAVFAYLADVFVIAEFRGRGIGKALVRAVLAHPDLQTLRSFMLGTRDAHGLYEPFGFNSIREPERLMIRHPSTATASG